VLFYSHDSFGLGHIRRTLSLCDSLRAEYAHASMLVLTGSAAIAMLPMPAGVDYVKLPCVTKVADEQYRSRFLPLGFEAIRSVRRDIIQSTARAYQPSLVMVDNVPLGLKGELRRTLEELRTWNPQVRVVLTLRDILDEPSKIVTRWSNDGTYEAIDRLYDHVVIYGSPDVFDLVREYRFPASLAAKCTYAGYISRQPQAGAADALRQQLSRGADRLVLVTVGGGGDGGPLVERYLEGLEAAGGITVGGCVHHHVVCGPEMPATERAALRARYGHRADVSIVDYTSDLVGTMAASDVVVSMGGYNTVCEILSMRKAAVVMPRRRPRLEQWIRCTRLAEMGLLRVVDPEHDPATRLIDEVRQALAGPTMAPALGHLDGLENFARLLPQLLEVAH
jgi:predicted glycosyltransferase